MRLFWLCVVSACSSPPEAITFEHSDGTGAALGDCQCEYYDGTDNDWSLELTCTAGNSTLESISVFADPRNTMGEGPSKLILIPTTIPGSYACGGGATIQPVGMTTNASSTQVIRTIDGIDLRWAEQDCCSVDQPCELDSYHLRPGSITGGHGGCEDYYATQRLILGS
jgi:hypothetical protein